MQPKHSYQNAHSEDEDIGTKEFLHQINDEHRQKINESNMIIEALKSIKLGTGMPNFTPE